MPAGAVRAQEVFTALLMQPLANLAAGEDNKDNQSKTCDITIADILGPLKKKKAGTGADDAADSRDANFSLLSYSFSLVGLTAVKPRATSSCAKAGI